MMHIAFWAIKNGDLWQLFYEWEVNIEDRNNRILEGIHSFTQDSNDSTINIYRKEYEILYAECLKNE